MFPKCRIAIRPTRLAAAACFVLLLPGADSHHAVHPLVQRWSREGFNVLAELRAALDEGAYHDATEVIRSYAGPEGDGLVPDTNDDELWVSLGVAIRLAVRKDHHLEETIQQELGPLARLRVKRAIAAGDEPAVGTVARQFPGTGAASEADRWLGDRCLSMGRFVRAIGHYRLGLESAADEQRAAFQARLRLAGALLGRDVGGPVDEPVEIGRSHLDADKFEQLVVRLRQARRKAFPMLDSSAAGVGGPVGLPAGRYQARPLATLVQQALAGEPVPSAGELPGSGAGAALLAAEGKLFLNSGWEQAAFDLATGRRQWRQYRSVRQSARQSPPMHPVLAQGRLVLRRPNLDGFELVCLGTSDGRLLWQSRPGSVVVSDPLLAGGQLFAFTTASMAGDKLSLSLVGYDIESGGAQLDAPLAQFRHVWQHPIPCAAAVSENLIVAAVGGCVLACDTLGRVRWIRRQLGVDRDGDEQARRRPWLAPIDRPPAIVADRVFAVQPTLGLVDSIDLKTGRLAWRKTLDGLMRLVGVTDHRVVAETSAGLTALDRSSGEIRWSFGSPHPRQVAVDALSGRIVLARLGGTISPHQRRQLELLWLDDASGSVQASHLVDGLSLPPDAAVGPLASYAGGHWFFTTSATPPAKVELFELVGRRPGL